MSKEIDEKVVQFQFDNKNFEKNVQTSMSTLDKLKQSLKFDGVAKGFQGITDAANKVSFGAISKSADTVKASFNAMDVYIATTLSDLTRKVNAFAKKMVSSLSVDQIKAGYEEYELKMDSLKTIMASTGESIESVNSYLNELNTYSDKTIYSFSDMTQNIGKFTNAGVSLKDSVAAIQGISNEAAVSGANANEASRAMYNFAQALSAGSVKLIDWKSIENANMATKEFKEQLIQTAVAEGTLVKKNGEYKTTTTNAKGAVSELFNSTKGFNDSLSYQWMTTDVLTKTLAKYADETTDIGKKATNAATKVTKFTQLVDTVKEAIGSGWSQTFEIIFGDLEEATKMYTKISKVIGNIVSDFSNKRNHLLEGVFGDTTSIAEWNMLKKAGAGTKAFRKELEKTAESHGVNVKKMIKSSGSFEKSLDNNWLTTEMLNETFKKFGAGTTELTKKQKENIKAAGDDGKALKKLALNSDDYNTSLGQVMEQLNRPSGRDLLLETLGSAFKSLMMILKDAKKAFRDFFPEASSVKLYNMLDKIDSAVCMFMLDVEENGDKIRSTFKIVFSVLKLVTHIVGTALSSVFKVLKSVVGNTAQSVLDTTASFGDLMENFVNFVINSKYITNAFKVITTFAIALTTRLIDLGKSIMGSGFVKALKELASGLLSKIGDGLEFISEKLGLVDKLIPVSKNVYKIEKASFSLKTVNKILDDLGSTLKAYVNTVFPGAVKFFNDLKTSLNSFPGNASDYIGSMFDSLVSDLKGFGEVLGKYGIDVVTWFKNLGSTLKKSGGSIISFLKNFDVNNAIAVGLAVSGLVFAFKALKVGKGIISAISAFANIGNALTGISSSYSKKLKSEAFLNIAKAVSLIVASIVLLAQVNPKKALRSIEIIAGIMAALVVVSKLIDKDFKFDSGAGGAASVIGMAVALIVIVAALKTMETLKSDHLLQNITILGGVMVALVLMAKYMSKATAKVGGAAIAFIGMAVALRLVIGSLSTLENMNAHNMLQNVLVLVGIMAAMGLIAKSMANVKMGAGLALIGMALALKSVIAAMQMIADMKPSEIKKVLPVMLSIMAMFAVVIGAAALAGKSAASAAKLMSSIGIAMIMMALSIKIIAGIKEGAIDKAKSCLISILAMFALIVVVSNFAGKHAVKAGGMLLMMAGACVILAFVIALLSLLDPTGLKRATNCMALLMVVMAAMVGLSKFAGKKAAETLKVIAVSVALLAVALVALSLLDTSKLLGASAALSSVMVAMTAMIAATQFIKKKAIVPILAMVGVVAALALIIALLSALDLTGVAPVVAAMSATLLALSAAMVIVSTIPNLTAGAAAKGALALMAFIGIVVSIFTAMLAALGAINKIDGAKDTIEKGIDLFKTISSGFGEIIGSFLGGVAKGVTNALPGIAQNLSDFAYNLQPFFKSMKKIDDKAIDGADSLIALLLKFTGADFLQKLESWVPGNGLDVESTSKQLCDFADAMEDFSKKIKSSDIDTKAVQDAAVAGGYLADLAGNLVKHGGILQAFTGDNDLTSFGNEIAGYAASIVKFSDTVSETKINVAAVKNAATAGQYLADLGNNLPNHGGVMQWLAGDNELFSFGNEIVSYASSIARFSEVVSKNKINTKAIKAAATAGQYLSDLGNSLPNHNGVAQWLTGDSDLTSFGNELNGLGEGLSKFSLWAKDIDEPTVKGATNAGMAVSNLANSLPAEGGALQWWTGDNNLSTFGKQMASFGSSLKKFSETVKGLDTKSIGLSVGATKKVIELATLIHDKLSENIIADMFESNSDLEEFGDDLQSFGNQMKEYSDSLAGVKVKKITQVTSVLYTMLNFMDDLSNSKIGSSAFNTNLEMYSSNIHTLSRTLSGMEGELSSSMESLEKAGSSVMSSFSNGAKKQNTSVLSIFKELILKIVKALKAYKGPGTNTFYQAGYYSIEGFKKGVLDNLSTATSAGTEIGKAALKAAKKALDEHSPSKAFYKVGDYAGQGFTNALYDSTSSVAGASKDLANNAKKSLTKAISRINDSLNSEMDTNPTIRPVLDLSDVQSGANSISGLLNSSVGYNTVSGINALMNSQNGVTNADVVSAINKLSQKIGSSSGDTYNINGITYDDGSNVADAVSQLIRAATVERRA